MYTLLATIRDACVFSGFIRRKEIHEMNEEELKALEEKLKAQEEELKAKEEDVKKREDDLTAKDEDLKKREEDVNGLVSGITKEYESKLKKKDEDFKKRLDEREKVIKQILNGDEKPINTLSEIEALNAKRKQQKRG